jgi:hypothetical protein
MVAVDHEARVEPQALARHDLRALCELAGSVSVPVLAAQHHRSVA